MEPKSKSLSNTELKARPEISYVNKIPVYYKIRASALLDSENKLWTAPQVKHTAIDTQRRVNYSQIFCVPALRFRNEKTFPIPT